MAAKQQKIDELLKSIDRRQVEEYVRTVLERARKRKGLTAEQVAELLGTFQPRVKDVAGRGRWYEWAEKPDSLTATAFVAASILAGITELGALPLNTDVEETGTTKEERERLASVERQLAELTEKLADTNAAVRKLARIGQEHVAEDVEEGRTS